MRIKRTPPSAGAPSGHPVHRKGLKNSNPRKSLPVCLCPPPKPYYPPPRSTLPPSSSSTFRALELYNHVPAKPDSALNIVEYENTPSFLPPVSWCAPGTTAEQIKSFMRPPVLRKQPKGRQGDPVDREVRVLAFSSMTSAYERRKRIADEEVAADLVAMGLDGEGLPVLGSSGQADDDDSSELSDPPESSTTTSSAESLDSRVGERVQDTPPTPWTEEQKLDTEAERVGHGAGVEPLAGGGSDSKKDDEREIEGKDVKRLEKKVETSDGPTIQEATALPSQHGGRHSRKDDQDEMVRRELAGLPDKRARKPRRLFGEDIGARPQLKASQKNGREKEGNRAGPSSSGPVKESALGKRKRDKIESDGDGDDVAGHASISLDAPQSHKEPVAQ